jgi:hypothetical protein
MLGTAMVLLEHGTDSGNLFQKNEGYLSFNISVYLLLVECTSAVNTAVLMSCPGECNTASSGVHDVDTAEHVGRY